MYLDNSPVKHMSKMDLLFNVLLLNDATVNVAARMDKIQNFLLKTFKFDPLHFRSDMSIRALWDQWEDYLKETDNKKSSKKYDKLVEAVTKVFGYAVHKEVLFLTTYYSTNAALKRKYKGKDVIVENVNDWYK